MFGILFANLWSEKREKCPSLEIFWFVYSEIRRDIWYLSVFSPNVGKCGPEKLRILTLFTMYEMFMSVCT